MSMNRRAIRHKTDWGSLSWAMWLNDSWHEISLRHRHDLLDGVIVLGMSKKLIVASVDVITSEANTGLYWQKGGYRYRVGSVAT